MNNKQAFERWVGCKIRVKNSEESALIQNQLFKAGFAWRKCKKIRYEEFPFLFLHGDGEITYSKDENYFQYSLYKELLPIDILSTKIDEYDYSKKVKIFVGGDEQKLSDEINAFLTDKYLLVDVQTQSFINDKQVVIDTNTKELRTDVIMIHVVTITYNEK